MKKFIIGIIICAVLVLSGQAAADSISKIGKKVDAEYTVIVDGEELYSKAVSFNGVSYVPSRDFGNTTGYGVELENDNIIFTKQIEILGEPPLRNEDRIKQIDEQITELEAQKKELQAQQ